MTEEILSFLNNEVVSYIMEFIIAFGGVVMGVLIIYNKTVKLFGNAKNVLNSAKTETTEQNKVVVENTKELRALKQKEDEVVSELKETRTDIQTEFSKRTAEMQQKVDDLVVELKSIIAEIKPLLNLPKAFIQTVINNPESVKTGVAKKVSDILEVNNDNIEKNDKVGDE